MTPKEQLRGRQHPRPSRPQGSLQPQSIPEWNQLVLVRSVTRLFRHQLPCQLHSDRIVPSNDKSTALALTPRMRLCSRRPRVGTQGKASCVIFAARGRFRTYLKQTRRRQWRSSKTVSKINHVGTIIIFSSSSNSSAFPPISSSPHP